MYARCTTCGRKLSHIQIPWEMGKEKINGDDKLDESKKQEKIKELSHKLVKKDCCRGILWTYFPTAQEMI